MRQEPGVYLHGPTPWRLAGVDPTWLVSADGERIAHLIGYHGGGLRESANGELLVRAPEMWRLLKGLVEGTATLSEAEALLTRMEEDVTPYEKPESQP